MRFNVFRVTFMAGGLLALVTSGCDGGSNSGVNATGGTRSNAPPSSAKAMQHQWPIDLRHVTITKDDKLVLPRAEYWSKHDTPVEEIRTILSALSSVEKERWLRDHHHVSGGDEAGWLVFSDGHRVKWVLRPGRLAYLEYDDDTRLYLAETKGDAGRQKGHHY